MSHNMDHSCFKVDYRKLHRGRPPVLLLGGLSQIWPLGFAHIPVILVTSEPKNPALASRYICGHCILPSDQSLKQQALTILLNIGRDLTRAIGTKIPLYCGNDHDLAFTYDFHEQLSEMYLLLGNGPELGNALLNKDRFHVLGAEYGLPMPRTYTWTDGAAGVRGAENPVIVKPRQKEKWNQTGGFQELFHVKAKVFPNGRAMMAYPGLESLKDKLFIQEFIPGHDNEIYSFHGLTDNQSELMAWFLGRKIRTFPKLTGESSFIELIHNEDLFRTGLDIVNKLGLRGVFKMDFKRDIRNGRFYLLEINARFNLWLYLGAVNGVNIPRVAYDYVVHGIRCKPGPYETKYKWNHFLLDYRAYRELQVLGELNFAKWARSLLTRHVYEIFSWRDPMPFVQWAAGYFNQRIQRWRFTAS